MWQGAAHSLVGTEVKAGMGSMLHHAPTGPNALPNQEAAEVLAEFSSADALGIA